MTPDALGTIGAGRCDVCGKPATTAARDIRLIPPNPNDSYIAFESVGPIKFGCEAHQAVSVEIE